MLLTQVRSRQKKRKSASVSRKRHAITFGFSLDEPLGFQQCESVDGTVVHFHTLRGGTCTVSLKDFKGSVTSVCPSFGGKLVAVSSSIGAVMVFNARSRDVDSSWLKGGEGSITSIAFSPPYGELVAIGSSEGKSEFSTRRAET